MRAKRLNILFVIGSLEIGGTEKQMFILTSRLRRIGFSCSVFALKADGPLRQIFEEIDVPVYCGDLTKRDLRKAPWKLVLSLYRLLLVIKRERPTIIHAFLPLVVFIGALAGRIVRVPMVITSRRGFGTHQDRYFVLKALDHFANILSHRVIVNSRAVWKDMIERDHIDESKLYLIYNGIDSTPFEDALQDREEGRKELGVEIDERVVIVVANLIKYKGHLDFLKAAKKVMDKIPKTRFLLVGEDRGIQKHLEWKCHELGISSQVKFMGQRNDIPQLLALSELSVLPSHEEGFSNTILESMAAGLPVVATNVGGNPEAVLDGKTGWLVPPENPTVMAEKIIDLLSNPERAKSWGEQGRKKVKKLFTVEKMVKNHLELYGK